MHRSGTSLLTRTLNLIGLNLGPSQSVTTESTPYNAKGHWEHKEISSICNDILKTSGGNWDDPPVFSPGWEGSEVLDDLRHRARKLITDEFGGLEQWGWKDPRACLTVPFWQQLIPGMRYILCLRNPVDVSLSLAYRDSFSAEKSAYLWFTYVCSALRHTHGKSLHIVFYEDLVDDCLPEVRRLAEFLRQPDRAKQMGVQQSVLDFVEKNLQHHRTSLMQNRIHSRFDLYARTLYLCQRISAGTDISHNEFDNRTYDAWHTLTQYCFQEANHRSVSALRPRQSVQHELLGQELEALVQAMQSDSKNVDRIVAKLSSQLMEIQTQLPRMKDPFNRRLITRYKHTRDYLSPMYRDLLLKLSPDRANRKQQRHERQSR
jgi:hypothetical protein